MSQAGEVSSTKRIAMVAGDRHWRLTAVEPREKTRDGARWLFRCECGRTKVAIARRVIKGFPKSCGCLSSETTAVRNKATAKHGMYRSPEYQSWMHMRSRCNNPAMHAYADYGGRGITVCERWDSFENFLADMGMRPSRRHTLDRKDVNGNYEPDNCRWATQKDQCRNKRANVIVYFRGRQMTLAEAIELSGIADNVVRARLRCKWSVERALTQPVHSYTKSTA